MVRSPWSRERQLGAVDMELGLTPRAHKAAQADLIEMEANSELVLHGTDSMEVEHDPGSSRSSR